MTKPYFEQFSHRQAPIYAPLGSCRRWVWNFLAGATIAAGAAYLHWRWTASLNSDAFVFSVCVATAESLFFLGTSLFYFDIWDEGDTPFGAVWDDNPWRTPQSTTTTVDIFVTTYDEPLDVVGPSLEAAAAVYVPDGVRVRVCLLDDGDRAGMALEADRRGISYFARQTNEGFKAGNLRHALLRTSGDFVVICDADTRLLPSFLQNTMGYFRDPNVAWVQTPHWFYDLPEGESWHRWVTRQSPRWIRACPRTARWCSRVIARVLTWMSGKNRVGRDPFLSDPSVFFDVIQRRRNRNGASFCCGAASIHRREAVFDAALRDKTQSVSKAAAKSRLNTQACLSAHPLQPYRFHVSEDLYTSILIHADQAARWTSVYHPQVEARMLSPWCMTAWAAQRLKYAGGTFDIAIWDNPLFRKGLNWRQKLHYGATFWSYLSILWAPVLLLAPVVSLATGWAPVSAFSVEFFQRFLPAVVLGELAMVAACKGHAIGAGRVMAVVALPVQLRALYCVLRRQTPQFAPTPKLPNAGGTPNMRHVWPHVTLLGVMGGAAVLGVWQTAQHVPGYSASLLWVNLFWLGVNMSFVVRAVQMARWRPPAHLSQDHTTVSQQSTTEVQHVAHSYSN
ncbi:glycosyltransferase [Shimia sagamensis]|uniref:Cellulose synthase (UDP-forming) n=1 Tax=Shimia sagamensis TaxID=1566352 RepID=A0ABY1P987_9RHOB|nr:glycosyltransferase [Shimia sagamensis]SMP28505.1 cellulose synthase (UDP-forming) [Shimia sagamensis]